MPRREHLVLCGGVEPPKVAGSRILHLKIHGPGKNVSLHIQDISKRLVANIPDELVDLLEVASYVYAADSAISRGGRTDARLGARWRRKLSFVIPVRLPDLWRSPSVTSSLVETLGFLSDDDYTFAFMPLAERLTLQSYLEFSGENLGAFKPAEVILFSGGLDSFSGAVEELVSHGKSVALVSHRSSSKIASAQKDLVADMRARLGAHRILHVPVLTNLADDLGREPTHRTRSFLFAALGTVAARLFGLKRIKFFENGIVSLNLPPVAQVVGARATRTTHPQAVDGFRRVLAAILGQPFDVTNPYVWLTKAEVVQRIGVNGFGHLVRHTRSCTRVHDMTILYPHCGHCSQCIDRRFAIFAAGLANDDPEDGYKVELFTGERPEGPDREMALAYVRTATTINQMADVAFFERYGEASRAVRFFAEPSDIVAERILDLHRRHAAAVTTVFDGAIAAHASALRERSLPPASLLSLVVGETEPQAGVAYPPRQAQPKQDRPKSAVPTRGQHFAASGLQIRLAIDDLGGRAFADGWGELSGNNARLLAALAVPFEEATREKRAPEHFRFTKSTDLVRQLALSDEENLRGCVRQCRKRLEKLALAAGMTALPIEYVIESLQWRGYRLNPDNVRLVAVTEIAAATKVSVDTRAGGRSRRISGL